MSQFEFNAKAQRGKDAKLGHRYIVDDTRNAPTPSGHAQFVCDFCGFLRVLAPLRLCVKILLHGFRVVGFCSLNAREPSLPWPHETCG